MVEVYNIAGDKWSPCPKLKIARSHHDSCVLGYKIYVFGSPFNLFGEDDSIEVADCNDLIDGGARWRTLYVRYGLELQHPDRETDHFEPLFSPISSHEILIMAKSLIHIFDVTSSTIEKVGTVNFDL